MDQAEVDPRTARRGDAGPPSVAAVLAICRVSNLPTVWMNVVAAAVLSGASAHAGDVALLALSLSSFYCAGMVLNDIFDRHWDAVHQPFRPLPAGRLGLRHAWGLALVQIAVALGCLLAAPHRTAAAPGGLLLALIFLYDGLHKRFTGSVFLMAGTRAMVFVVTSWALVGTVPARVLVGGAAQFVYTLLVTAVARHEHSRGSPYGFPLIPRMIAGMSVLDGALLAALVHPAWLLAGAAAAALTRVGQRYIRGD